MFEIRGLSDVKRKLDRMSKNVQALSGSHDIPASELFPPTFMRLHTKVASFEALFEAGGFKVESQDDFEAIPDAEWENLVRSHTSFSSWHEMQEKAAAEYFMRRLKAGL
jgi:hypothetical protein